MCALAEIFFTQREGKLSHFRRLPIERQAQCAIVTDDLLAF